MSAVTVASLGHASDDVLSALTRLGRMDRLSVISEESGWPPVIVAGLLWELVKEGYAQAGIVVTDRPEYVWGLSEVRS